MFGHGLASYWNVRKAWRYTLLLQKAFNKILDWQYATGKKEEKEIPLVVKTSNIASMSKYAIIYCFFFVFVFHRY